MHVEKNPKPCCAIEFYLFIFAEARLCRGGCANLIKGASFLMQILPAGVLFNFVEKQEIYLESIACESFEKQIKRRKKNDGCVRTEETIKVPRDYADQGRERKEKGKKNRRPLSEALSG